MNIRKICTTGLLIFVGIFNGTASARTNLFTYPGTIDAFASNGIPSTYYTSAGGVDKYKNASTMNQLIEMKFLDYSMPAIASTPRIRYRNYGGMAALEEFNPSNGAAIYYVPQCVGFVKGMTGDLSLTSAWYPGAAIASVMSPWTASAMTGMVMAYFGSDNPATTTSYGTAASNGLSTHVLIIVKVNMDSTGKVLSAVVVDQNFNTPGSISRWTIPYNGSGRGFLKNYRIVQI